MAPKNPIICAIDTPSTEWAHTLVQSVAPHVGMIKLGLEFFVSQGGDAVRTIRDYDVDIFLDLKFHDIPNTVSGAVSAATELGVAMLTVHAAGGSDMLKAAVEAAHNTANKLSIQPPMILAVTMLTSIDQALAKEIGIERKLEDQVIQLAGLAVKSGADGCVCSAHELQMLRKNYSSDALKLVVPGIRPETSKFAAKDDQKRIMTPQRALEYGADYIVIGRPITKNRNPAQAAKSIKESLAP